MKEQQTDEDEQLWEVPITVTEYGRCAVVEAKTRAEAILKARACDWIECTDANNWLVRKSGPAKRQDPPPRKRVPA